MFKSGFVNIIGYPNAGKSTLINSFLNDKLSIITEKAQTTRHKILGIENTDDYQLIFTDNPGYTKPANIVHEYMNKKVKESIVDGDIPDTVRAVLRLYTHNAEKIPYSYVIEAYAVSQSWEMGIGRLTHNPKTTEGVSWQYRDGQHTGTEWHTSSADIPFAPQPYSGVDYQMAGTKNTINYNPNKKYSVEPPRKQNTLNVCSITKNNSKDFNSGKRKCYKIYSSEQNVTGDICSSIGTDGPEYSTDKGIIDGNSNWKRGNTFGANFSNDVNNRVIYKYMQPKVG